MFNLFKRKDYVFVLCQEKFLLDEDEKSLRKEVDDYINSNLKGFFGNKTISYTDIFTESSNLGTVNILSTCQPAKSPKDSRNSQYVLSIVYQVWAYVKILDERIFSIPYTKKTFESEKNSITLYTFKI